MNIKKNLRIIQNYNEKSEIIRTNVALILNILKQINMK